MGAAVGQDGKGAQGRRTTTDMDALGVAATRLSFEDGWTNEEIGSRLGIGPNAVAACIRRARSKGLVALRVVDPAAPALATAVEQQVEGRCDIRRIVAVKVVAADEDGEAGEGSDDARRAPDRGTHRQLALAGAHLVSNWVRNDDKFALGAGRTMRFLVEELRKLAEARPRSFHGVEVISLTGNPIVRRDTLDLNSDAIATAFGRVFDLDGPAVYRVDHPYVVEDPQAVMGTSGSRLLVPTWQQNRAPDVAIVGLGVLGPRHHLMVTSRDDERLAPVRKVLDRLEQNILSISPSAVIDVYDTFWLRHDALPSRLAKTAAGLLDELNSKIVALPRPKLDLAREKIVIAGGLSKYDGVLAYLRQHAGINFTATTLITDANTAERLVGDLEGRQPRDRWPGPGLDEEPGSR